MTDLSAQTPEPNSDSRRLSLLRPRGHGGWWRKLLITTLLVIGVSAVAITGVYYFLSIYNGSAPSPATMLLSVCAVGVIISAFWSTPLEAWGVLAIWFLFIFLILFYVLPAEIHQFSPPPQLTLNSPLSSLPGLPGG